MRVVILAAGPGKRLKPFTEDRAKCMVEVDGKTILERQIESFKEIGINKFVFCVGPFKEKIESLLEDKFPEIEKEFVFNDKWESTNYIYTMWLAKEKIVDDLFLLHGDLVFDIKLLETLIENKENNCVPLRVGKSPEKDFKALVENEIVKKISVEISGDNTYFFPPIYKLTKNTMRKWIDEIEKFVKKNEVGVYAENALNSITSEISIIPSFYENIFCMEIDDKEDLKIAEEHFKNV